MREILRLHKAGYLLDTSIAILRTGDLLNAHAARQQTIDAARDALSEALEDPDAGNDDVRDAAIRLCQTLNAADAAAK